MTKALTIRLDEDAERALAALTADGRTRTEAVKAALLAAERAARRAQIRAEAEAIMADPAEVEAMRRIGEYMDEIRAW